MGRPHERFEEMAVAHVLGGLASPAAAEFREHLLGCRDCRLRVAELRDIASDLEAAERDEARSRVKTETRESRAVRRDTEPARPDPRTRLSWASAVFGLLAVLVVVGFAFWNFHLRDNNATLRETIDRQEAMLALLATGRPVDLRPQHGVSGTAAMNDTRIALDLLGLPPLERDQRLVVWLIGGRDRPDGALPVATYAPSQLRDGRLPVVVDHHHAASLVVAVEDVGALVADATSPSDAVLVRASLTEPTGR